MHVYEAIKPALLSHIQLLEKPGGLPGFDGHRIFFKGQEHSLGNLAGASAPVE